MTEYENLDLKNNDNVCMKLWEISGSLKGLGELCEKQCDDSYLDRQELFGIGQLLNKLSNEVSSLENCLRCRDYS